MKISTIAFLIDRNNVYLSEKRRGFGEGYLNGYGGKVAYNESVEEATIRELNEECNVIASVEDIEKVAILDFFEGDEHIFETHVFFIHKWGGEPKESEEMALPEIHDRKEIPYDRMWKSDQAWLPLIFGGEKIKAKACYKKGMAEMDSFEYEPLL